MSTIDSLSLTTLQQAVPVSYAEKAMASLMQLHGELMEEKERRVDLFRRLMEREQALAELKMYVKLLEEKLAPAAVEPAPAVPTPAEPTARVVPPRPVEEPMGTVARAPPVPPRVGARRPDGWRVW